MTTTMESDETKIAVLVEKVGNMNITLSKLDGKLDTLNDKFATREQVAVIERKVTNLESWRIYVVGAATAIAVIISFAKDWILKGVK